MTRPSKQFESLFSRVSSPQFLASTDNGPSLRGPSFWSPDSSPIFDFSSTTTTTTTTAPLYTQGLPCHDFLSVHPTVVSPDFLEVPSGPCWSPVSSPSSRQSPLLPAVRRQPYSQLVADAQVLYHNPTMFDPAVTPTEQHLPRGSRWHQWLEAEARRRLVTVCFIVDVHTSIYQQQRRAQDYSGSGANPTIPLTWRSAALWEASSAVEWVGLLAADPEAGNPTFIPPPSAALTPEDISGRPAFDRAAILAHELLRLPRRPSDAAHLYTFLGDGTPDFDMDLDPSGSGLTLLSPRFPLTTTPAHPSPAEEQFCRLFAGAGTGAGAGWDTRANVYLALHHTPLHDLLAVSGDTWIFSQKVLTSALFAGHQQRTKAWAGQQHAVSATVYAARAILGFLGGPENGSNNAGNDGGRGEAATCLPDITDYWGLYVCALVCWAFGHAARRCTGPRGRNGSRDMRTDVDGDAEALAWLQLVARARWPGEAGPVIDQREESPGVIRLVRRKLERDCVGGRNRLYVDAVGVLKKLEEEDNRKWF